MTRMKKIVSAALLVALVVASILTMASCGATKGPSSDPATAINALKDAGYNVELTYGLEGSVVMNTDITYDVITATNGKSTVEISLFRTEKMASAYEETTRSYYKEISEQNSLFHYDRIGTVVYGGLKDAVAVVTEGNDELDIETAVAALEAAGYTVIESIKTANISTPVTVKYTKLTATNDDGEIEIDYFLTSGMAKAFYNANKDDFAEKASENSSGFTYLSHSDETYVYSGSTGAITLFSGANADAISDPDSAKTVLEDGGYTVSVSKGDEIELEKVGISYYQYSVTGDKSSSYDNNGTHLTLYYFTNEIYKDNDLIYTIDPSAPAPTEDSDADNGEDGETEDSEDAKDEEIYVIFDESAAAEGFCTDMESDFKSITTKNSSYNNELYGRVFISGDKTLVATVKRWFTTGQDVISLNTTEENNAKNKEATSITHKSLDSVNTYKTRVNTLLATVKKSLKSKLTDAGYTVTVGSNTTTVNRVTLEYLKVTATKKGAEVAVNDVSGLQLEIYYCDSDFFDSEKLAKSVWDSKKETFKDYAKELEAENIDYDYFIDLTTNTIVYHGITEVIDIAAGN